jgi:hypothetical protein
MCIWSPAKSWNRFHLSHQMMALCFETHCFVVAVTSGVVELACGSWKWVRGLDRFEGC